MPDLQFFKTSLLDRSNCAKLFDYSLDVNYERFQTFLLHKKTSSPIPRKIKNWFKCYENFSAYD